MDIARILFDYVAKVEPQRYQFMLHMIQPHSLEAVLYHFQRHLETSVPDLHIFNRNMHRIPDFCFHFVKAIVRQFPTPGDSFGIQLTCRVTKNNTQGTLDSKHLQSFTYHEPDFNVDSTIRYELQSFTNHAHFFEMSTRHEYATVFTSHTSSELLERLPNAGVLERGAGFNKSSDGRYLRMFDFIIVEDKVLYKNIKSLFTLLCRLTKIDGFSDIRMVFQKCGLISYFFNVAHVVKYRFSNQPIYAKDIMTVVKFQCRTGRPLPLTREGLAKNPERSPLEVISFEAPKTNFARYSTINAGTYPVKKSADKMFFGQQFNEGTAYFALKPRQ